MHLNASEKQSFHSNGFIVLKQFFDHSEVARLKNRIDRFWRERDHSSPLTIDCYEQYPGLVKRLLFREVDNRSRDFPYKLNDTHLVDETVQHFAINVRLVDILRDLLESDPMVCNTLIFERSSEQEAHFDTFYMPSKTPNKMCATWIALDPVTDSNGPLFYYPRSHLAEPYRFSNGGIAALSGEMDLANRHIEAMIKRHGLEKVLFFPQSGDVFIWHAQLLHGGSPITDMRATRTSLVTHYWTLLDIPDPSDRIDLGDGRYLFKKPHQFAASKAQCQEIEAFLKDLKTPPEHLSAMPDSFDARRYLLTNPDVFSARADPYSHYHLHGRQEGRYW
jgi:phytanoyl-CoA hydroxylase